MLPKIVLVRFKFRVAFLVEVDALICRRDLGDLLSSRFVDLEGVRERPGG